jgi:UDP-N-acetylmuramate dehydrogenase
MPAQTGEILQSLAAIPGLQVSTGEPLSRYTRFGIGGPALILAHTSQVETLIQAATAARHSGLPLAVIGAGSNLIVADAGFGGIVLRFTADEIGAEGTSVTAGAGAELQTLVDFTIERGLGGIETLTRIPGSVGAAIYGNAGAYGHSIAECVDSVNFLDGESIRSADNSQCEFNYRESVFKRRRDWLILSAKLSLEPAAPEQLRRRASEIARLRDEKFPPTMKCAGSIFKNLLLAELPAAVAAEVPAAAVREGKVAAAWFLEQAGAKGASRGGIRVADYHANLIYNAGDGTAGELRVLIAELKSRVRDRFGFDLEEEVQYLGFQEEPR